MGAGGRADEMRACETRADGTRGAGFIHRHQLFSAFSWRPGQTYFFQVTPRFRHLPTVLGIDLSLSLPKMVFPYLQPEQFTKHKQTAPTIPRVP